MTSSPFGQGVVNRGVKAASRLFSQHRNSTAEHKSTSSSAVCLSSPGTNTRGQRLVDLSIDGMGFGYIVLDDCYTFEELASALGASLVRD